MDDQWPRLGTLGIPLDECQVVRPMARRDLDATYTNLVASSFGQKLTDKLANDSRVQALLDQDVVMGSGYGKLSVEELAKWMLWRANCTNVDRAEQELNTYLDNYKIPLVVAIWVSGIDIDEELPLFEGYALTPFSRMPESFDKYFYHSPMIPHDLLGLRSDCAITRTIQVDKRVTRNKHGAPNHLVHTIGELGKIEQIADLLCLIHDCRPRKAASASYIPDNVPCGRFVNSSCGGYVDDVTGCFGLPYCPTETLSAQLASLYQSLNAMGADDRNLMAAALRRLSQAKRRIFPSDEILDLTIVLEMLLVGDGDDFIAERLASRGAEVLSDRHDADSIYDTLKKLYTLRSRVVHTGMLSDAQNDLAQESRDAYELLVEEICESFITHGMPRWDDCASKRPCVD